MRALIPRPRLLAAVLCACLAGTAQAVTLTVGLAHREIARGAPPPAHHLHWFLVGAARRHCQDELWARVVASTPDPRALRARLATRESRNPDETIALALLELHARGGPARRDAAGRRLHALARDDHALATWLWGKFSAFAPWTDADAVRTALARAADAGVGAAAYDAWWAHASAPDPDDPRRAQWLLEGARAGDHRAQRVLGSRSSRSGVQSRNPDATRWLRAAAEQGDLTAQDALAERLVQDARAHEQTDAWFWSDLVLSRVAASPNADVRGLARQAKVADERLDPAARKRARHMRDTRAVPRLDCTPIRVDDHPAAVLR